MSAGDDETSVEAEWDAEIDVRVQDIEEGRVELVSSDEAIARVRARLAARRAEIHSVANFHYPSLGEAYGGAEPIFSVINSRRYPGA